MIQRPTIDRDLTSGYTLGTAARVVISSGYERVLTNLKLAAANANEIENVHQLRVATRRLLSALNLFQELLPKKARKRTAKRLKRIRRAAGRARDLDVLIESQSIIANADKRMVKQLKEKRTRAQQPILKVRDKTDRSVRAAKDMNKLLYAAESSQVGRSRIFSDWSRRKLGKLVARFFAQSVSDQADAEQLHRFRIAAKEFRYSLDVLEAGFPPHSFGSIAKDLRRLQNRLGEINDSVVAIQRFKTIKERDKRFDGSLLKARKRQLKEETQEFMDWWTPEKSATLHDDFERLIR